MELKNATLAALFIILLTTKLVESAGRRTTKNTCNLAKLMSRLFAFLVPPTLHETPTETLQQVGVQPASTLKTRNKKEKKKRKRLPRPSTGQRISLVPDVDPIENSPDGQRFREAVQGSDMSAARKIFNAGNNV